MTKSSSTGNYGFNKNNDNILSKINFKAEEIRTNDIFENPKKKQKEKDIIKQKKIKVCYKCSTTDINENNSITFSCNHISCYNCIIKDLILLKFKNLENKEKIRLNCSCLIGSTSPIEFSDFLQKIKEINKKKEERQKCKQHQNIGIKYCKECELWLCNECINIHSVFNNNHNLLDKEISLKVKCKSHKDEFSQYYCLQCKEEVCSFCITKGGKHDEHKIIKLEKFINLAEEIKSKLKYKTFDECSENLDIIKEKKNSEKNGKIKDFKEKINNLINRVKIARDNYIKEINDKMNYLNQVIDIIKEC